MCRAAVVKSQITGIVKRRGVKIEKSGVKYNIFLDDKGFVNYIIPKTGVCVHKAYCSLSVAADHIPEKIINETRDYLRKPECRAMKKIFRLYVMAERIKKLYF